MQKVAERLTQKTPKFFRRVRNIGLTLTAISAALIAQQAALPGILVKLSEYLAVAGSVAATVGQAAVVNDEP